MNPLPSLEASREEPGLQHSSPKKSAGMLLPAQIAEPLAVLPKVKNSLRLGITKGRILPSFLSRKAHSERRIICKYDLPADGQVY